MGRPSPECRSRLTFDRSPVRESRTPGSARGAGGNSRSYRDQHCWMHPNLGLAEIDCTVHAGGLLDAIWLALIGFRGDGERAQATSASIKEPSKAFPRLRAL